MKFTARFVGSYEWLYRVMVIFLSSCLKSLDLGMLTPSPFQVVNSRVGLLPSHFS